MSKRVIKQLSDMQIDEVSLVDRGANQHALISIAKRYSVADAFAKARHTQSGGATDEADEQEFSGDDPAGVVDEYVSNDGHGDTGAPAGKSISGTQKTKGEDVTGKAGKARGQKTKTSVEHESTEDSELEETSHGGEKNLPAGLRESAGDKGKVTKYAPLNPDDEDYQLAKALGLWLDDESWDGDVEKGFGPPEQSPNQQSQTSPQFGSPPQMQSVGAQPMGQGAPVPPQNAQMMGAPMGGMQMGGMQMGPNPQNPGMPTGGPQVPGPTAMGANPMAPMGLGGMMGQNGAPPQLSIGQLPPEVTQYIQQLEKQVAQLQGQNSDSGADSSDSNSGSSNSDNSDSSNKPFGKSGAFTMDENAFYEELSKAIRDEDGRAEFSKALQTRFAAYEEQISKAQQAAEDERNLRLEREFIAKSAEFTVPVAPEELGPVLKRAYESLSDEDFAVIVKCLDAATELADEVFGEVGKRGAGANHDIFSAVQAEAEELRKSFELTGEQAASAVFEANPEAYDQYLQNRRGF